MSFINRLSQAVTVDTANSLNSTILAGVTWNSGGTGTSLLGVNSIQIVVKSDQNLTIFVDQGRTNSSFQVTDSFAYNSIKDNFGITVQAVGQFVRVRALNPTGSTATVTIDTLLCPILDALPRALGEDSDGQHLKVGVHHLADSHGNDVKISPAGWMDVNQPYRLIGTTFAAAIDTTFWTATNNGTGSASGVANSIATVTSGTAANAWAQLVTVRQARFIFNNANRYRSLTRVTALTQTATNRYWGVFTATAGSAGVLPTTVDGFYFALDGSNVLTVNSRNAGGSVNSVASGSFNGDVSTYTMDTNVHAYEIVYFLASIQFFIDNVLIHTFTPSTAILSSTATLPIGVLCTNTGGTNNATLEMWAGTVHRLGRDFTQPKSIYQAGAVTGTVLKNGAGVLRGVINGDNVGTVIFYDATSATNILTTLDLTRAIGDIEMNLPFYTGLTYTTTGTPRLTVIFE